jgi:hypothetical protein
VSAVARATSPFRIGLVVTVVASVVGWTHASPSRASSKLTVKARTPTPGAPATTGPVIIDIHAAVTEGPGGAPPPQLSAIGLRMPLGFSTAVTEIPPCTADVNAFKTQGSAACAPSLLGTGKASAQAYSPVHIKANTQELSIFRGTGNALLAYVKILGESTVLPGTLDGPAPNPPLLRLDLGKVLKLRGMSVFVTSADLTLARGLQAGPCPTGSWTFTPQLEFVGADPVLTTPPVPCVQPGPVLRASVTKKSKRASGAHFRIVLVAPATINITLERRAGKRWIAVRSLKVPKPAGSNPYTIHTAHGRPLPAGRYRATLQAQDAAGATSAPQTLRFRLVR